MNRLIQIFNLFGVLVLSLLLAFQWEANSRVNQRASSLELIRQQQLGKLEEQDRAVQGYISDLEEFRNRLKVAEAELKDLESKLNQMTAERNQLVVQRDQLKSALGEWIAAVNQRDTVIRQASTQIQKLAAERDEVSARYNKLVKDWNSR